MKTTAVIAALALLAGFANRSFAPPQPTAFTYQGWLTEAGAPASGLYDFRLAVFDDETAGDVIGLRVDVFSVPLSNGLFTVECDPGEGVFNGSPRWLQISVRPHGGSLTTLSPRQRLTATPHAGYAIIAGQANGLQGSLPAGQIAGTLSDSQLSANIVRLNTSPTFQGEVRATRFAGDGGTLTNVNAASLGGLAPGAFWQLSGNAGTAAGTDFLGTTDNQPLEFRVNKWRTLTVEPRSWGAVNVVAGYRSNTVAAPYWGSVIAGGGRDPSIDAIHQKTNYEHQVISGYFCNISGGIGQRISSDYSTISGGYRNQIGSNTPNSVIAGGANNQISSQSYYFMNSATIGGGGGNRIEADASQATIAGGVGGTIGVASFNATIGGGNGNTVRSNAVAATISGGDNNVIGTNASHATIPGGISNEAAGKSSFAAGRRAHALHDGAFVWGDATDADIASTNANSVTLRAGGGYRLFSHTNATAGTFLAPGGGSWTAMSDRNAKENFAPVDVLGVLEQVVALPMTTWNYKSQDAAVRHLGPMAQDFQAAFKVGECDTGITTVDADGVALAAIQGLNQKLESTRAELKRRECENAELRARLERLERALLATGRN